MNEHLLTGLDGSDPLGFLAALGVLNVTARVDPDSRLSWPRPALLTPLLHTRLDRTELIAQVKADAASPEVQRQLTRAYPKVEKKGKGKVVKQFAGLQAPVGWYRAWAEQANRDDDGPSISHLTSLYTESPAIELEKNKVPTANDGDVPPSGPLDRTTSPTFFDFSSRNRQFLDQAKKIVDGLDDAAIEEEMFTGKSTGGKLAMDWSSSTTRPAALSAGDSAPLSPAREWLAFRALELFVLCPGVFRPTMAGCLGRRKSGAFHWWLWEDPLSLTVVRSILDTVVVEQPTQPTLQARGVHSAFRSGLARERPPAHGGLFAPAEPYLPQRAPSAKHGGDLVPAGRSSPTWR